MCQDVPSQDEINSLLRGELPPKREAQVSQDFLSQDEVDALLRGVTGDDDDDDDGCPPTAPTIEPDDDAIDAKIWADVIGIGEDDWAAAMAEQAEIDASPSQFHPMGRRAQPTNTANNPWHFDLYKQVISDVSEMIRLQHEHQLMAQKIDELRTRLKVIIPLIRKRPS